jgi:phosphonate transport system permease protein
MMQTKNKGVLRRIFHKLKYKKIIVSLNDNGTLSKIIEKKRSLWPRYFLIVAAIFGCCFIFVELPAKIRFDQISVIFGQMFTPSEFSLKTWDRYNEYIFATAIPAIWSTVEMVFIGTTIGTAIAIPLFLIASRNIVLKWYIYQPVRIVVDIIRTIPTYVLAILCTVFFGIGNTAGIWAIAIFTMGIMFKLMYEYIDTCNMNPFEASMSTGATRFKAARVALYPQVKPMFFSNFLYTFEINVRASVILGFVGAGGIGQLLSNAMDAQQYDKVGAILIPLFVVVVVLQLLSSFLRRKSL